MAISDPITENPVITKYKELVATRINNQIVYHDGNLPDSKFAHQFAGNQGGISTTPDLIDAPITAQDMYNVLLKDVNRFTRIRRFSASINISGAGGGGLTPNLNQSGSQTDRRTQATENMNFSCEWVTAFPDTTLRNDFKQKWGRFGVDDLTAATQLCEDAKVKSAVANRAGSIVATARSVSNQVGILSSRHRFDLDSSDVTNNLSAGQVIDDAALEVLFNALYDAWSAKAISGSPVSFSMTMCHSNCHSNCHASRGRR
jgi:hypothetical protein